MNDTRSTLCYPGFRFPAEIIGHAVWLYHRFTLSFRDSEVLLAERGIIVTHETIRQWCLRFGQEYANSIMNTDKLASYGAARKQMRLSIEHRQHKGLNNRAENSHQPTRQKERQMKKFKSPGKAQRFLSAHGPINNLFRPRRHLLKATAYRAARKQAFSTWLEAIDHAVAA